MKTETKKQNDMIDQNIYIIEGGKLRKANEEDEKKVEDSRYYRVECEGLVVLDYDKHNARPYIKDLLNRSGVFLEIKLLKVLIGMCLLLVLFFGLLFVRLPSKAFLTESLTTLTPKQTTSTETNTNVQVPSGGAMNIQDVLLNK